MNPFEKWCGSEIQKAQAYMESLNALVQKRLNESGGTDDKYFQSAQMLKSAFYDYKK